MQHSLVILFLLISMVTKRSFESLPLSMRKYLLKKLDESFDVWRSEYKIDTGSSESLLEVLLAKRGTDAAKDRKALHEEVEALSGALRNKELTSSTVLDSLFAAPVDDRNRRICIATMDELLAQYNGLKTKNMGIFVTIAAHHNKIASGGDDAYKYGTTDIALLQKYGVAAYDMGQKEWVKAGIKWMEMKFMEYFAYGGAKKVHLRSLRRKYGSDNTPDRENRMQEIQQLQESLNQNLLTDGTKLRLLDIGSCYNPFETCSSRDSLQEVMALDLFPMDVSVLKCDFLTLNIGPPDSTPIIESSHTSSVKDGERRHNILHQLPENSYDIATISLVLNYLPTPQQRHAMLRTTHRLLTKGGKGKESEHHRGLLLIMEKASVLGSESRIGSILQHWKDAISAAGFEYITYQRQKLENRNYHVFAFRVSEENVDNKIDVLMTHKEYKEYLSF